MLEGYIIHVLEGYITHVLAGYITHVSEEYITHLLEGYITHVLAGYITCVRGVHYTCISGRGTLHVLEGRRLCNSYTWPIPELELESWRIMANPKSPILHS